MSARCIAFAIAACAALAASPLAAQSVPTRVVVGGPIRLDDAFVTMSYACVSFTDLDARSAAHVVFGVRFTRPDGETPVYTFARIGTFSTGIRIAGPSPTDQHAGPEKLANCAQLEAPEDSLDATFFVAHVDFADGSQWNPQPNPTPSPAATSSPAR